MKKEKPQLTDIITIPPEAWKAAMSTYHKEIRRNPGGAWQAAIRAALKAWPGVFGTELEDHTGVYRKIILPLPKEKSDA